MNEVVLSIKGLSKNYGKVQAVKQLELEIPKGSVFGLLGPNGSGKTTTLGMVLGVVNPVAGSFRWFNENDDVLARKRIGAILERPTFYPYMSGWDNLDLVSRLRSCGMDRAKDVLEMVGLYERKDDKFKGYSLGMKQRLAIASAMLADPEVLVLDEPTNGLDPMGIAEIRDLIRNIAAGGKTIILASHLLDEVQKVCTDFVILKNGKKIHSGKVNSIGANTRLIELGCSDMNALQSALNNMNQIKSLVRNNDLIQVSLDADVTAEMLCKSLAEKGIFPGHIITREKNLEELFLQIVNEN